jgi:hypothetical protein
LETAAHHVNIGDDNEAHASIEQAVARDGFHAGA